jgi:hypothetical protein
MPIGAARNVNMNFDIHLASAEATREIEMVLNQCVQMLNPTSGGDWALNEDVQGTSSCPVLAPGS